MTSDRSLFSVGVVPVPNRLFDEVLPTLSDTELRVLLVVIRATFGWREGSDTGGWRYKQRDWISHRQLLARTGRKSAAVSRAVSRLIAADLIQVEDQTGRQLRTATERRSYIGRLYFRPGDMWITPLPSHPPQAKRTTDTLRNRRRAARGWQKVAVPGSRT